MSHSDLILETNSEYDFGASKDCSDLSERIAFCQNFLNKYANGKYKIKQEEDEEEPIKLVYVTSTDYTIRASCGDWIFQEYDPKDIREIISKDLASKVISYYTQLFFDNFNYLKTYPAIHNNSFRQEIVYEVKIPVPVFSKEEPQIDRKKFNIPYGIKHTHKSNWGDYNEAV